MNLDLNNKVAVVLGSSQGIGLGIAKVFQTEGAKVIINSRNETKLRTVVQENKFAGYFAVDHTKPGELGKGLLQIAKEHESIDVLVVNTGGPPKGNFSDVTEEKWQEGFRSLWLSTVEGINSVLPIMKDRKFGRIILITSLAAREPIPGMSISNGLRAGLLSLAKSLSFEVAPFGITVNCILPGYIQTERLTELGRSLDEIARNTPVKRLGTAEEIGYLAAFLASSKAAFMTGQMISCDGGISRGI